MKFSLSFIFLFLLILTPFVSSQFGFDNPNLPEVTRDPPTVITFNNVTGSVNSSSFWDNLDTFNTTQMEDNAGTLNILVSWLTILIEGSFNSTAWQRSGTNVFLANIGDRVGIGTNSPGRLFEVFGSASVLRLRDSGATASSTTAFIEFGGTDSGVWNRTGWMGDGSSASTDISIRADVGDLILADSSGIVLTLSGGDTTFLGNVIIGNNLTADGNFSLEFGDLISEQNPDAVDAIRIKGTGDIDVVLGGMTDYFSVWNSVDDTAVFFVDNDGNTDVLGDLTVSDRIVFGFGEIIDNIVNGWIRITGNLNVTGNITSENVFIPQYHFTHTNETIELISVGVWKNLTFTEEITDIQQGITHIHDDNTNTTFTINEDGIYEIDYNFDVIDTSGSSTDIDVAGRVVYFNGTEIVGSVFETDITKKDIETELSHSLLAEFISGDQILFQFTAQDVDVQISTHGTFGDNPESASIIIKKIANLPT